MGVLSAMEENVSPSRPARSAVPRPPRRRQGHRPRRCSRRAPSTASRISDRLTAAGLITREVAPDNRRATLLELTPAGRAVLADLAGARARALERVTEAMSRKERDALLLGAEGFARAYDSLARAADDELPDPSR